MILCLRMPASLTYLKYVLCLIAATITSCETAEPSRYDLIHYLLDEKRYDHSLPPALYTGNATDVFVKLLITDLNSASDIDMEFEFAMYVRLNWNDSRLDFTANGTSYDSIKLGDDIVDSIWIPDLYFEHERKSELHGLFTKNQLVYIYKNGSIQYSGRFNIKVHCPMDLSKYPYDIQTLQIFIQSYAFTKDELLLHWNGDIAIKFNQDVNLGLKEHSQYHTFISPYADPVGKFSTLTAKISFHRQKKSLEVTYIAPPVILVTVSLTSFLLGDNVHSRISVPTGVLTQIVIQWAGLYSKLPPMSVLTMLDGWMLGNLGFVGLVLIVNAFICHCVILKNDKEKKEKKSETISVDTENKEEKCMDISDSMKSSTKGNSGRFSRSQEQIQSELEGSNESSSLLKTNKQTTREQDKTQRAINYTNPSYTDANKSSGGNGSGASWQAKMSKNRCSIFITKNVNLVCCGILLPVYIIFFIVFLCCWRK